MNSNVSTVQEKKRWVMNVVLLLLSVTLGMLLFSAKGWAVASGSGGDTDCPTVVSGVANKCNSCITSVIYENLASGSEIINAMFTAINSVLDKVEKSFFNGIVTDNHFQQMIATALVLYVAMYGLVITFNLGSYRVNEVATRLVKVGLVYMLTSPTAWASFNTWVNIPLVGGMNQLIREFTKIAESGGSSLTNVGIVYGSGASGSGGGGLDPIAFASMFGSSMTTVFSVQLATAIVAMAKTGFFGWLISVFLLWGLIEFLLMIIGAIVTYCKAIIGLAFLFGISPLFFIFLLFDKTRNMFMVWVQQITTFALQPVMLFAFLSFYVALINEAAPHLLEDPQGNSTDFCWMKWQSVPGALWDMFMWAPTVSGALHPGPWSNTSGNTLPEPINVPNALYFLMLCHLGKTFSGFIDTLARDIGSGISIGTVRGSDLSGWSKKAVGGAVRGARGKK